jgi:thioesterase domain-containing protein/acyl carrier protein
VFPENKLEFELLKIWERVLGVSSIGVMDNFFSLGGHSLLAIRLFLEIEETLGKKLPMTTLFQAPTVQQLAKLLREEQRPATVGRSSLVAIQTGGSKPPFFCLPGNMGNVFTDLSYLAQTLGPDYPFYGLQDGIQNPTRIEALAAHYLNEIQIVQPEGPYFLGGICSGGVIAFDIARQLKAQGQQVALLALVEPSPPSVPGLSAYIKVVNTLFHRFINRVGHHSSKAAQHNLIEQIAYLRLKVKVAANLWAAARYAPQPYLGRIQLFLTRESFDDPTKSRLGWRNLATDGAEIFVLPGNHNTVTGTYEGVAVASMQYLAKQLKRCIDDALIPVDANR